MEAPFYIAGALSFATMVFVFFILKESLHISEQKAPAGKRKPILHAVKSPLAMLYFLQFFISVSLSGLEATFAYFAAERAGLNAVTMGYVFMIMGLASAAVQGSMGPLTKKFGEERIIQIGIFVSAIGLGLILLTENFVTAAIFLAIFGVGNGVIRPSVSSLLTKQAKSGHGEVTGYLSSFGSLGRIIGPVLGGALYMLWIGMPYVSGIVLSAVAFVLFRFYLRKHQPVAE